MSSSLVVHNPVGYPPKVKGKPLAPAAVFDPRAVLAADDRLESLALPMFKDKIDGIAISRVR